MKLQFSLNRSKTRRTAARVLTRRIAAIGLALALTACQTVRTTDSGQVGVSRTQLMAVSAAEIDAASAQSYRKMLQEARKNGALNTDPAMLRRVRAIAARLTAQTGVFRSDASGWQWETNIFQSEEVNAFCMAGGKIGVYSGLITKLELTDDELAAVMGHEIAHALREHVREQVSRRQALKWAGVLISVATGSQELGDLSDTVTDVTMNLPMSREAETEADEIGVELAARAGYDPRAAITLWRKMTQLGGSRPPEFLSTHPAPQSREQNLARTSELVMPLYRKSRSAQDASSH